MSAPVTPFAELSPCTRPSLEATFALRVGEFAMDVDLSAMAGITVLFGPSGSGKSLTLATIAGLRRPATGTIAINGRTVADAASGLHVRSQDRHVGMVFQDSLLLPHRNVRDNVALAVREGARQLRRNRAGELLASVGATQLAGANPARLSGGERQRIALARALAGTPALLLLDEPFSALDHTTRRSLRALLRTLVDTTGVTTLMVTHDPDEAAELADRIIDYRDGATVTRDPM